MLSLTVSHRYGSDMQGSLRGLRHMYATIQECRFCSFTSNLDSASGFKIEEK